MKIRVVKLSIRLNRLHVSPRILRLNGARLCILALILVPLAAIVFLTVITTGQHSDVAVRENGVILEGTSLPRTRHLDVPYIDQGDTKWCFGTALSMVLQYYGNAVAPSDIAAGLGDEPDDSVSFFDLFFGSVDSYLSKWPQLSVRHGIGALSFSQYVELIDAGIPVIVSTFGMPGHTLVVVGYSIEPGGNHLYVHDPSGYYSKLAWGTGRSEFARVDWSVFSKRFWTELVITSP